MMSSDEVAAAIERECAGLAAMLLAKNASYGNSALSPLRVFSRADAAEQLRVRIDDKLSRLARAPGSDFRDEDTVQHLLGDLVLLRIAERSRAPAPYTPPVFK